ncbi:HlyC/CorC family transporter [Thermodesulforhabdus norvegica]|uniref:Mg2+ and Co2+ transporter CorB, contains DUF21, CBS pair, and CorC-HlyC domains n=1 Tax=Thermodesulforhabdus norvegica TaxID=39841 RepID=A0A1I4QHF8_9BACT|nr:CNNM domain-containing protein [Thermodesulforhabdus norvegica]SFM39145.1 Mg2+ and Co2+ transporter CorB, contains DUF21, CBS pair, and CorC-HlyC domains [Thermodesulforhabdus norvegica]
MKEGFFNLGFYGLAFLSLFALSAFFSGSETAFTAANRFRMGYLSKSNPGARKVKELLDEPEKFISTLLLCNNLVNVALSAMATALAIRIFGNEGVLYATFAVTVGLLVFGEITPKTIAAYHADRISIIVAPLMSLLVRLCYPVVKLLTFLSMLLIKSIGLTPQGEGGGLTEEELEALIETGVEEAGVEREKQDMLLGVLLLDRITLGDIMVPWRDVVCLDLKAPLEEVMSTIEKTNFSRYPVYKGDFHNVVGFIHVKDVLLSFYGKGAESVSLESLLRPPQFAPEFRTIRDQLAFFKKERSHMTVVVNEYGHVIGLVTLEDVLEEIVGDIADEHDAEAGKIIHLADGSVVVDGSILVRDLNRYLDMKLPEAMARTVAGLIISVLDRFPEVGEVVVIGDYHLQVVRKEGFRVRRVRIWEKHRSPFAAKRAKAPAAKE